MPYGRLDVIRGVLAGKSIVLPPGTQRTIGRLPDVNDLPFEEPSVSSRHFKIYGSDDGFWLEDVGSRNGTLVNGERVDSVLLEDGDVVRFGRSELTFRLFPTLEQASGAKALDAERPEPVGFKTQRITNATRAAVQQQIDGTLREPLSPPEPAPQREPSDNRLGQIAVYNKMITEAQLAECVSLMEQQPGQRLGELLVDRGYLSPIDLELVLRIQNGAQRQADGKKRDDTRVSNLIEIALKKGHLKQEQLKHATVLQARSLQDGFVVPLDEILLNKGYLRREHYLEIIKQQGEQGLGVNIPGYDRYELIGYGGMGAVYKARQISMDRPVAIKVLSERFRDKPRYRERFLREARNVAKLNHENIIAGYDFGESGSVSYFVMEFVEGRTCEELLQERRRLDDREAAEIVLQVGRALQHAFEKGMIHRDIKPENIMITAEDRKVKLCDLGLAWSADELDEGGKGFGTPNYMSPEQIRGQTLDIRTDIYSLGVTLYRMLFGKLPFHGASPMVTMSKHLNEPLQFPDETMSPLQRALSAVIARMLAKHPNERHQDPSMLVRELEGILDRLAAPATTAPIAAVPPPAAQPPVAEEDPRAPRKRRSASARLRRGRRR